MQELIVRSKTRKSIVQAVTSHIKFQSWKINKLKMQGDPSSSLKKKKFNKRFFSKIFFLEKKLTQFSFLKIYGFYSVTS